MWFDADNAASVQIGTGVSAWTSAISANAITATQATANNQPSYQLGQQAGRNAIYCDGVNDSFSLGDRSSLFPSAASVVAAYRPDSDSEYTLIRTATNYSFWNEGANLTRIGTFKGTRLGLGTSTTIPSSGTTVVSVTSDSSAYRVYVKSTLAHDVAADFLAGTSHAIGINDLGTLYKGWIYEILYFSRALSDAEVKILNSYLSWKWSI
jgi:hypothetical protein